MTSGLVVCQLKKKARNDQKHAPTPHAQQHTTQKRTADAISCFNSSQGQPRMDIARPAASSDNNDFPIDTLWILRFTASRCQQLVTQHTIRQSPLSFGQAASRWARSLIEMHRMRL